MKKLVILIMLIFICGCTSNKKYTEIGLNDFETMLEEKKDFVLFIGSSECSHCTTYKGTVNQVIKNYDVKIHYIDIIKFSSSESSTFSSLVTFSGTPTTVFYKNGKENVYNRLSGSVSYDKLVAKLKELDYIKG
jgi:predicted bacteriocin transport accessory protein